MGMVLVWWNGGGRELGLRRESRPGWLVGPGATAAGFSHGA